MIYTFIAFLLMAIMGFVYGKQIYLKRVAAVLHQMKIPTEEVDKTVFLISQYSKIQREASKQTKEAFKKSMVEKQLENMKKED